MAVGIWLYTVLCDDRLFSGKQALSRVVFNRYFIVYLIASFCVSGHWFVEMHRVYGNPLFQPDVSSSMQYDPTGWHTTVLSSRPHAAVLFAIGIPYLCPFFGMVYLSFYKFYLQMRAFLAKKQETSQVTFLWLWILPFIIFFVFFSKRIARASLSASRLSRICDTGGAHDGLCETPHQEIISSGADR